MTANTRTTDETMRHIPDEELHAYLDQSLSRSQCVEIESHLATCPPCRGSRDTIAALRDQTTALLATLTPPRRFMPAFELLKERAAARSAQRAERWRAAAWAASVLVAVGLGWGAQSLLDDRGAPTLPLATRSEAPAVAPAAAQASIDPSVATDSAHVQPVSLASSETASPRRPAEPATRPGTPAPISAAPAGAPRAAEPAPATSTVSQEPLEPMRTEVSSGRLVGSNLAGGAGAVWRTLSWDGARRERGAAVPRIAGLPVVEVQMGQAKQGEKPVVVVAQQLSSGEVIHTIEGPAKDVSRLLAAQPGSPAASPWPVVGESGISGVDGAMAVRRGDRMLAITADGVPRDSLRAMIRRMNAEDR